MLIDNYINWVQLQNTNPNLLEQYIPDGVHPTSEALLQIVTSAIISALTVPEPMSLNLALAGAMFALCSRRIPVCKSL